jgi:hypothetical protein
MPDDHRTSAVVVTPVAGLCARKKHERENDGDASGYESRTERFHCEHSHLKVASEFNGGT